MSLETWFDDNAEKLIAEKNVLRGKMFGSDALKINGKVFSMIVKNRLVVKLPKDKVNSMVTANKGIQFDPGHGKLMKEWVEVEPGNKASCMRYMKQAMEFVGGI